VIGIPHCIIVGDRGLAIPAPLNTKADAQENEEIPFCGYYHF